MIKLTVSGCQGRMGKTIRCLAIEDGEFKIKTLLEHKDHPDSRGTIEGVRISTDSECVQWSDVLIEFTLPDGTMKNLKSCVKFGIKMVIGTTGFTSEQIETIKEASEKIPIVFASNMSVGVNILFKLTQIASEKTGQNYTINMTEAHHMHKKDAPSGTAKTLAEFAEAGSGQKVNDIKSIREGEIIGDHEVVFESGEDIIKVSHHAKNRDIFAKGSLVAAKFLMDKKTGLYNMQDVLGFK